MPALLNQALKEQRIQTDLTMTQPQATQSKTPLTQASLELPT